MTAARAPQPVALGRGVAVALIVLSVLLAGCPALLSDWSLGTGVTDGASDALSPDVTAGGFGSGSGATSGSPSGSTGGSSSSGSTSGSSSGSSGGGADASPAPEEAGTHLTQPDGGRDVVVVTSPDAEPDSGTAPDVVDVPDTGVDTGNSCGLLGSCGATCQTKHDTGVPNPASYFDCNPVGNSSAQATDACGAFMVASGVAGGSMACSQSQVSCAASAAVITASICGSANGKCYCWQYEGPHVGTVQTVGGGGACSAACGTGSDPTWN